MIATAVLAADYAGTLELNEVTTLRGRGTQGQGAGVDFVEAPTASVRVADRLSSYTLTYSPTLTLPDFEEGIHPQLINVGNAIAAWHHRSTSFTVTEGAMYGVLDSAYLQQTQILIPGQQATLNAVPNPGVITVFGSTTDATLRQGVGRRVVLSLSGDYFVSSHEHLRPRVRRQLMTIFRSTGPVISTRRSSRSAEIGAAPQSLCRIFFVSSRKSSSQPSSSRAWTWARRRAALAAPRPSKARCSLATSPRLGVISRVRAFAVP